MSVSASLLLQNRALVVEFYDIGSTILNRPILFHFYGFLLTSSALPNVYSGSKKQELVLVFALYTHHPQAVSQLPVVSM